MVDSTERQHILRQRILRKRIEYVERLLAQLDEAHAGILRSLAVAAAEFEELLALHEFLVLTAEALPRLSLEQWRALDLLERCAIAREQMRTAIDANILERNLNRFAYGEFSTILAAIRAELAGIGDATPAGATTEQPARVVH